MLWHFLRGKEPANLILHLKGSYFIRKKKKFQTALPNFVGMTRSIRVPLFKEASEKGDYNFHKKFRHFKHG